MAVIMSISAARSQRPAAVDDVSHAGPACAFVTGEIDGKVCNLVRGAEAPHRLARDELLESAGPASRGTTAKRRRVDGARADGVAADPLGDEIGRDGAGQRR